MALLGHMMPRDFQDRCLKPLGHPSAAWNRLVQRRSISPALEIAWAMRGVTPALSARRRPLHHRLAESEEPTASPRRSPETDFDFGHAGAWPLLCIATDARFKSH